MKAPRLGAHDINPIPGLTSFSQDCSNAFHCLLNFKMRFSADLLSSSRPMADDWLLFDGSGDSVLTNLLGLGDPSTQVIPVPKKHVGLGVCNHGTASDGRLFTACSARGFAGSGSTFKRLNVSTVSHVGWQHAGFAGGFEAQVAVFEDLHTWGRRSAGQLPGIYLKVSIDVVGGRSPEAVLDPQGPQLRSTFSRTPPEATAMGRTPRYFATTSNTCGIG
jgi:hypothetical protein